MAKAAARTASAPEQTGLATTAPSNDQLAALGEVFDFDLEVTGLEGADADDIKMPALVFNIKGKNEKTGRMRQLDEFMLTDTEETFTQVQCVLVAYTKSNRFTVYNDAEGRNDVICQSYDRVTGTLRKPHPQLKTLQENTERPCATCPDQKWHKDEKGKNKKNCAEVSNVFALLVHGELDAQGRVPVASLGREFMVRFSKTSLAPFEAHLNKHHFKKHPTIRGRDVPLFAYVVTLTLAVDSGGNYAVPVLTKGAMVSRETAMTLAEIAKGFFEVREEYMRASEKQEEKHADSIDTEGESSGGARRDEFADDDR